VENNAARQWRDGCAEKLANHIRYSSEANGSTSVLCRARPPRESSLQKPRMNEDIPIDARTGQMRKEQTDIRRKA
jgi:hypothetical protein